VARNERVGFANRRPARQAGGGRRELFADVFQVGVKAEWLGVGGTVGPGRGLGTACLPQANPSLSSGSWS
jgi:hypothetical protein